MNSKQRMRGRRMSALGLALLVALAFGAIAASGAQALTWQHSNPTVLSGTSSETVAGTGASFVMSSEILGFHVEVDCSTASTSGSIVAGGTGSSTINLAGCSVAQPSGCALTSSPSLNANIELVEVGGTLFQKFVPSSGKTSFGTFGFAGAKCVLNEASASLRGSFAGREVSSAISVNRTLSFNKVGSWPAVELKFGTKAATLAGEDTQHLSGAQAYHAWRGIWQSTHGGWELEQGSPFSVAESATLSGGPVKFSFETSGTPISFSCSKVGAASASLVPGGTESISGLSFSACKVESQPNCTLGTTNSLTFEPLTGTLTRVGGSVYEKFAGTNPNPEKSVVQVFFTGSSCPLVELIMAFKGSFAGLGPEFSLVKTWQPLQFSDAANTATGSQLVSAGSGKTILHVNGGLEQGLVTPWGAF